MSKKLTNTQIKALASKHGLDYNALKAVADVECRGSGFDSLGRPVILFERHVFYKRLGYIKWIIKRREFKSKYPSLCNTKWGGYNSHKRNQHKRLEIASNLVVDNTELRAVALESCSWGIGQVMGYHWKDLGYASLQEFINDMYESEAKQLEAMIRFIKKNKLDRYLNNQQWSKFAYRYNGRAYKKNRYHIKLAKAYRKFSINDTYQA